MSAKIAYSPQELAEIAVCAADLVVTLFPEPGDKVKLAFEEMHKLAVGTIFDRQALHNGEGLPRPWIPATCKKPELRTELLGWLDEVVGWLNLNYTWDTSAMIPPCWPMHPHIVNELAVVASRRWIADDKYVSDALEDWHHDDLPGFVERIRTRLGNSCDDGEHAPWPGNPRYRNYLGRESVAQRKDCLARDQAALARLDAIEKEARKRAEDGE